MKLLKAILLGLPALAVLPASACYTVYDRSERVVYQSEAPPVDMSRPLHETLPARFPGGHLIFNLSDECQVISSVASGNGGRDMTSRAPLLMDERTAVAMKLPHTMVAGGVALVQARDASLAPGLTVLASTGAPDTRAMGAGPAQRKVITELRDPPVTIEQLPGGRVTIHDRKR